MTPFKRALYIGILILIPTLVHAQLGAVSGYALAPASLNQPRGAVAMVPIQYGQIRVCTTPVAITTTPCATPATIYDLSGNSLNVIGGNFGQTKTDITGFYNFQCSVGEYFIQVAASASNVSQKNFFVSCGSVGGAGTGPSLQTNGSVNAIQTVLNLIAGTNISLSSDGAGGVTVNNTGPALSGANTWTGNDFWTSGHPSYDYVCVNNVTTDSAGFNNAIALAESNGSGLGRGAGGPVNLIGTGADCQIDGTQITIGTARHSSPLIIQFWGRTVISNGGLVVGKSDIISNTKFFGMRGGNPNTSFGTSNAEITGTGGQTFPMIELIGASATEIAGLTIRGFSGTGATGATVRVHDFDRVSAGCPSPPCGATQIKIHDDAIINNINGGRALSLDNSGAVIRGAWSNAVTYNLDDEVTVGTTRYVALQGSNLNNNPTGGAPWWVATAVGGFDVQMWNNVLNANDATGFPLYIQDFGNVSTTGPGQTWMINGSNFMTCSAQTSCSDIVFDQVATEDMTGDFIKLNGAILRMGFLHIDTSDNFTNFYLVNNTLAGTAQFIYVKGIASTFLQGIIDPASNPVTISQGSDVDLTMLGKINGTVNFVPIGGPIQGRFIGQIDDLRRNGNPSNVRYPNVANFLATSFVSEGFGTGVITTGIKDYLGGTGAGHVVVTSAPYSVKLYNQNLTPSVGDVAIARVAIRGSGATSNQITESLAYQGGGLTQQTLQFVNPFPTGFPDYNDWHYLYSITKVATTDGMNHVLDFNVGANATTSPFDLAYPILFVVPAADSLSDQEIMNIALSLTTYSPNCAAQALCTMPGQPTNFSGSTAFEGILTHANTANRTYTFPDATGTIAQTVENTTLRQQQYIGDQGTICTNGELALSAGWQSTGSATVTAVAGNGQTCSWTITTGTTTAANPTVTDTLTNPLPAATTVCELNIHGGTHTAAAGEGFQQTTLSATAPIFTFNGTPTAGGTTYFVTRRCGP